MRRKMSTNHLPFASLVFDSQVQRSVIPARVRWFKENWDFEQVGAITVSVREDGKAYVIDGQHRVRTAIELGYGGTKVLCHTYRGLTLEEEAEKFLALNNARPVTPVDKYKVGLVARDPVCLGVRDTLAHYGLRIGAQRADGAVCCVSKAMALYEKDPDLLDGACAVLTEAWGTRGPAYEQVVFAAVGSILGRYDGELNRAQLAKKLAKYRGGPAALVGDARGLSDYKPISVTRAAAEIMVDTYNKGKRSGQLSPL